MRSTKNKNLVWHESIVTTKELEKMHGHKGTTVWFTGLPCSGKSTLANKVAQKLHNVGVSTIVLDGDNIRHGLNRDLGFSPEERKENIRRIAEVAKLFTSAGIVNLTAFISPYVSDRQDARLLQPETFVEVHCHARLEVCERRDTKGQYRMARAGEIQGFTGINAPYEPSVRPEIFINTGTQSIEECVDVIICCLECRNVFSNEVVSKIESERQQASWF